MDPFLCWYIFGKVVQNFYYKDLEKTFKDLEKTHKNVKIYEGKNIKRKEIVD